MSNKIGIIGARFHVPEWLDTQIERVALSAAKLGHTIITGGAPGTDQAAIRGALLSGKRNIKVLLPWETFEEINLANIPVELKVIPPTVVYPQLPFREMLEYYYDRSWETIRQSNQKLMGRNYDIVQESDRIIAFPNMKDGHPTGGTQFGIWIAKYLRKPVTIIPTDGKYDQWDLCSNCGCHRTLWDCGGSYHGLKAYSDAA